MNIFEENPIILEVYDGWDLEISKRYIFQKKGNGKKKGGDDDEFEEFDIMNVEEPEKQKQKQKQKPLKPEIPQDEGVKKPKTTKLIKTEVIYVENTIFPEDSIADFKKKIHAVTGIEMYKQHLFYLDDKDMAVQSYTLEDVLVDIRKYPKIENVSGVFVDRSIDMNEVTIYANDVFITMGSLGINTWYLANIDNFIPTEANVLLNDEYQLNLVYNTLVLVYWPMLSMDIFKMYLEDSHRSSKEIKKNYPPIIGNLQPGETELLSEKYSTFAAQPKELMKYNPFDYKSVSAAADTTIKIGIKCAVMTIEHNASLNLRSCFETFHVSETLPIIRFADKSLVLTKILSPDFGTYIQEIYEQVKLQLKNEEGSLLFVLYIADMNRCIFIVVRSNSYDIRVSWRDEDHIGFQKTVSIIMKYINPFIEGVNKYGRNIFDSATQLPYVSEINGVFSKLNILIYVVTNMSKKQFSDLRSLMQKHYSSNIIQKRTNTTDKNVEDEITFYFRKGITSYDTNQIIQSFDVYNRYAYLFDPNIRQRWEQLFDLGAVAEIVQRTTDLAISINDVNETEFEYFYQYITFLLYLNETYKTNKTNKNKGKGKNDLGEESISHDEIMSRLKSKNILKTLKSKDPVGFNMKQFDSDIVYSRICQKTHQPIPFHKHEVSMLPVKVRSSLVKFWNFTTQDDMFYFCPNPEFPYLTFVEGHPKNYCLPCCKKNPPYTLKNEEEPQSKDNNKNKNKNKNEIQQVEALTKRSKMYFQCLEKHVFTSDTGDSSSGEGIAESSRYVMNYGKELEIGRVGRLPDIFERYLLYNISDKQIVSDSLNKKELVYNNTIYSVDRLIVNTKNIKVRRMQSESLFPLLEEPVWSFKTPGKGEISPLDVLKNPKLSPNHYKRILEAKLVYPILIHESENDPSKKITVIDGMHRLAFAYLKHIPQIDTRFVSDKQLEKAFIKKVEIKLETKPSVKGGGTVESTIVKKPGYFIYGVPQHTSLVTNVGVIYSISSAMKLTPKKYVESIILSKHFPRVWNHALYGTIIHYFASSSDLTKVIKALFIDSDDNIIPPKFYKWNELFIDLTKLIHDIDVLILEDKSPITVGTSIKIEHSNMNIVIPSIRTVGELIPPPAAPQENRKEYILIFKRPYKTKVLFGTDPKHYYPIFIFNPLEFSKTGEIEQRIFSQNDEIIKLLRGILELILSGTGVNLIHTQDLKFISEATSHRGGKKYSIDTCFINQKNMIYGVLIVGPGGRKLHIPIEFSSLGSLITNTKNPIKSTTVFKRSMITAGYSDLLEFFRLEYSTIPKFKEFIVLNEAVIGARFDDLIYYFRPVKGASLMKLFNIFRKFAGHPLGMHNAIFLNYDPDVINSAILSSVSTSVDTSGIPPELRSVNVHKYEYRDFVRDVIGLWDKERNTEVRAKLKTILEKQASPTLEDIKLIVNNMQDAENILKILSRNTSKNKRVINEIENQGYNFDRKKLVEIGKSVLSSNREEIVKIITRAAAGIKKVKKELISEYIDILVDEFMDPIKSRQLLSAMIYIANPDYFRFTKNPNEDIYFEILD